MRSVLLRQQDSQEAEVKSTGDSKTQRMNEREDVKLEVNKDAEKDRIAKTTEKTCPSCLTSMSDDSQQKQHSTTEHYFKGKGCSSSESQQEEELLFTKENQK